MAQVVSSPLNNRLPNIPLSVQILSGFLGYCCNYFQQMDLRGKLVREAEIKSDGDLFHDLFRNKFHHMKTISPAYMQNVDLHEGHDWGTVGTVFYLNYTHDGKVRTAKEVVDAIDDEKKLVRLKILEGDLMELYKTFTITLQVDTKGENNLVTWTLEYEKLNANVEDPNTLLDMIIAVTRDIETHHLK